MKPHILYEDQDIIVCLKPAGIPTQTSRPGLPDMVSILIRSSCEICYNYHIKQKSGQGILDFYRKHL